MCLLDSDKIVCESHKEKLIAEIKKWNQIEQMTFMLQNVENLSVSMLKFFTSMCVEHVNKINNNDQVSILEEQANNLRYFELLIEQPLDKKAKTIISYLPLLDHNHFSKDQLKNSYFNMIIDLLEKSFRLETSLCDCRLVVQLAFYHPIFDNSQKLMFKKWGDLLEKKILQSNNNECSTNVQNQLIFNEIQMVKQEDLNLKTKVSDSNYSTGTESSEFSKFTYLDYDKSNFGTEINESTSSINSNLLANLSSLSTRQHKPLAASNSLPPFSPIKNQDNFETNYFKLGNKQSNFSTNSIALSNDFGNSSESFHDYDKPKSSSNEFNENGEFRINFNKTTGAKNIYFWLKNLRLHKYKDILCSLSYDDLMNLTDEKLMRHNITLGARKKILSSIEKLRHRNEKLDELIKACDDLRNKRDNYRLKRILEEMYEISLTPMKPQNSPPTSLADLSNIQNGERAFQKNADNEILCSKIIQFLQKAQVQLQNERLNLNSNELYPSDISKEIGELTNIFLRIIDKLFLTRAFTDYQNTQLSDLRNSFNEKDFEYKQNSRSKSPTNHVHNQTNNYANARLRIQNKNSKNLLGRTASAPYNQGVFDKYILVRDNLTYNK